MKPSSVLAGGERKTSTSDERANWSIFVSSLVETITVLESSGSICVRSWKYSNFAYHHVKYLTLKLTKIRIRKAHTCITTLRVVALLQSLQSSRHKMMNSLCCILARTRDSTARAWLCQESGSNHHHYNTKEKWIREVKFKRCSAEGLHRTCSARFFGPGAGAISPGVSIIVRFGQYLYSTLMIISLVENWQGSSPNLIFSASMYACAKSLVLGKKTRTR